MSTLIGPGLTLRIFVPLPFAPTVSRTKQASLVVGETPITARVNGQQGTDEVQMELCDNDRGAPQNSGNDAMRWISANHGDTDLTYLTGGNIVDHGS